MRFVREVKEEERQELERMINQEIGRVSKRASMILLSSRGYTVPEIVDIHKTTNVTVYKWFDRFDEQGTAGLYDLPRSGRPSKVTQEVKDGLEKALEEPPTEHGQNCTIWTVALLQTYIKNEVDIQLSGSIIRNTLHSMGYRWRRPRWSAVKEDPHKAQIMKDITRTILNSSPETQFWLQDETKFRTLPPLRRMWMKVGQQVRIPTPEINDSFYSYGAINLDTGDWFDHFFDKANSESTIAYLEALKEAYPDTSHVLIWDQASYHTSKKVERWLKKQDQLTVLLLPKYSPELNPVESIWRIVKQRVAANLTRLVDELKKAYLAFFETNDADSLLQTAGLAL
jgi:transposase